MIPKFQAWDKNKRCMKDVDFTPKGISFDDVEFMQSTGIKDINGNEIFEADILKNNAQEYIFLVRYDYDNCRWFGEGITINTRIDITKDILKFGKYRYYEEKKVLSGNGFYLECLNVMDPDCISPYEPDVLDKAEIIGNIFENPTLEYHFIGLRPKEVEEKK